MESMHKPDNPVNAPAYPKSTQRTGADVGVRIVIDRLKFINYVKYECNTPEKTALTARTITTTALATADKGKKKEYLWELETFRPAVNNIFGKGWEQASVLNAKGDKKCKILESMLSLLITQIRSASKTGPETESETNPKIDYVERFLLLLDDKSCKALQKAIAKAVSDFDEIASPATPSAPSDIKPETKPYEKSADLSGLGANTPQLHPEEMAPPYAPSSGYPAAPPPAYTTAYTPFPQQAYQPFPQQAYHQYPAPAPAFPPQQQHPAAATTPAQDKPLAEPGRQVPYGGLLHTQAQEDQIRQLVERTAKISLDRLNKSKSEESRPTLGRMVANLGQYSEASVNRLGMIWPSTLENKYLGPRWKPKAGTTEAITDYLKFENIIGDKPIPVYDTGAKLPKGKEPNPMDKFIRDFRNITMDRFGGGRNVKFEHETKFYYQFGNLITSDTDASIEYNISLEPSAENLKHFPERTRIGDKLVQKTRGETTPFELLYSRLPGDEVKAYPDPHDPKFRDLFGRDGWYKFSSGAAGKELVVNPFSLLTYNKVLDDALAETLGVNFFESPENITMLLHASMQGYTVVPDRADDWAWSRNRDQRSYRVSDQLRPKNPDFDDFDDFDEIDFDEIDFGLAVAAGGSDDIETDSAEPNEPLLRQSAMLASDREVGRSIFRKRQSTHFLVGPPTMTILRALSGDFDGPCPGALLDKFQ